MTKGRWSYVKERVRDHGTKYVILDFKEIRRVDSNGIREIIDTYHALKRTNLYLCHIGDEDKHPHKMLKMMGITKLTGIEVREELERTVIELAKKI